jgi:hypothetical protein
LILRRGRFIMTVMAQPHNENEEDGSGAGSLLLPS